MEAAEALAPRPAAGNVRAIPSMRRLLAHVRTPLHRDGYALVVNSVFTAGTGVVYWVIAAKLFSPHAVGLNSALVSSMMFLAGLAGLNLVNILVRFLPDAGRRTVSVIAWSYAATGLLAAVAALVFLAGVHQWAPKLGFLVSSPLLAAWFVLASVAWGVFSIQDGVLAALCRAGQ